MKNLRFVHFSIIVAGFWLATGNAGARDIDFTHQIVPIFKEHCAECHTEDKKKGGFSMNTRESLLAGGKEGKVVFPGDSVKSKLIELVSSTDPDTRMPPKGAGLTPEKIALLRAWIDGGAVWDAGFAFKKSSYDPPLKPRRPELPAIVEGRENPIDRIVDAYLSKHNLARPEPLGDAEFARRVQLDLAGLLPDVDALEKFLAEKSAGKRERLVHELLSNDTAYAEHWLTFWNDLLRNDYVGTGYIDGGRSQISKWLYRALLDNMPYDQFARELIAPPSAESAGFSNGIKWRGTVSAGQGVELQFAQSISQTFLGMNLKCASCHDSFIDRWKLDESYGLAAVFAKGPLQIYRCDKAVGRQAQAAWLFPELGQVDASKPQPERLKQLAALMTHPENGRFTRTIVNRLWHRLMGRGIVHPTDSMQAEPWSADLLDFLASDFAAHHYDLKHTLELIATSQAYQSKTQSVGKDTDDRGYIYAGPRAKRITAEQLVDAVWGLTGSAPTKIDAPVVRGLAVSAKGNDAKPTEKEAQKVGDLTGKWVWSYPEGSDSVPKPGETITLRKQIDLRSAIKRGSAVMTVDNELILYVNGKKVLESNDWQIPVEVGLESHLKAGKNELILVAKNAGSGPNAAAAFFEARLDLADGSKLAIGTDASWAWTKSMPDAKGKFKKDPGDWKPAALVKNPNVWNAQIGEKLVALVNRAETATPIPARASLMKCDLLMRALGRPNREQIVSVRPSDLSTLEAIDLANAKTLADLLARGAKKWLAEAGSGSRDALIRRLFMAALSRPPTTPELDAARQTLGAEPTEDAMQDLLWAVIMQPEFQMIR